MDPIPWSDLTETAQNAVADVIELLAGGFTGELTLRCGDGGVKEILVMGGKGVVVLLKDGVRHRRDLLTTGLTPK